ncbi:ZrgA family zinc uptake protein [Paraferrimonas sedimenticola]|nr:DUF2796 domain-containing protein [Paraferrimonas sedimenticola]
MQLFKILAVLSAGLFTHSAIACGNHDLAHMDMALEGQRLDISLSVPADSLVHAGHQDSHAAIATAKSLLEDPSQTFAIPANAQCQPVRVQPDWNDIDHKHADGHMHVDVTVRYQFTCDNPEQLTDVSVRLFEHFDALSKVKVQIIDQDSQHQMELNSDSANVALQAE